ncbi:hypothetical protein RFI_19099 [Reticulomyxa filosa]|uniref:ATPase AAA-type core domain-containing protein n=1 Tax=Reticulomyxa filosa TaxID=46433 RepID=X6MW02_RETFI|nr:hypothetical protein RFI_19099 [Reticulomyxa filosa]|eukprot:ETO18178.1 hypothetical protein RFI_19099 [Reticulomyxa filosa]
MKTIDVHSGYTAEDLEKDLKETLEKAKAESSQTHLIFLDEINTSPEIGAFKEVVCDHSLKGKAFPDNVIVIAALNPYRTRPKVEDSLLMKKAKKGAFESANSMIWIRK